MTLETFLEQLHGVKKCGDGYTAKCPAHDDRQNSLSVTEKDHKILAHCHAGCSFEQIIESLGIEKKEMFQNSTKTKSKINIVATYDYTDEDGNLLYQSVRLDPKDFRQRRPNPNNSGKWIWNLDGTRKVLYRLPTILEAVKAKKKICVVEGEKDVESLDKIGILATTNAGGAGKWLPCYTDVLKDTTVLIIPDNDPPGEHHAQSVHEALPNSYIIRLPDLPIKGDVSDWIKAGGTREKFVEIVRATIAAGNKNKKAPDSVIGNGEVPFVAMGFADGKYLFYSHRFRKIVALTTSAMRSKTSFYEIAEKSYWELTYPGKLMWDTDAAADDLLRLSAEVGEYDPSLKRKRGAWIDNERIVLHMGQHLIVDGEKMGLTKIKSKYVYESARSINIEYSAPISTEAGLRLISVINDLPWEQPIHAALFAGWLAMSPVCGILDWRSHMWLAGASGSGKSWVMKYVVDALLGDYANQVQSLISSSAGVRQAIASESRPVIYDETEAEDKQGLSKMQEILDLMRQASSQSRGKIVKGGQYGTPQSWDIKCSFLLSSVGVTSHRRADVNRITVVTLKKRNDEDAFERLKANAKNLLTPSFRSGFITRSCNMAKTINANADVFAQVISREFDDRRFGDQLGAIIAGYWSLWSDDVVSLEEAKKYINEQRHQIQLVMPDETKTDELRCLSYLLEQQVRFESNGSIVNRTIGELIEYVFANNQTADDTLERHGIKWGDKGLYISTSHDALKRLFAGTQWELNWSRYMLRIPGVTTGGTKRFKGGIQSHTSFVPWHVFGTEAETEAKQLLEEESLY